MAAMPYWIVLSVWVLMESCIVVIVVEDDLRNSNTVMGGGLEQRW